jgi:hypothetical protein
MNNGVAKHLWIAKFIMLAIPASLGFPMVFVAPDFGRRIPIRLWMAKAGANIFVTQPSPAAASCCNIEMRL